MARFIPLLEEDAFVEANIPWRKWLESVSGRRSANPAWFVQRIEELGLPASRAAQLYDSLRMPVRWHLENSRISRHATGDRSGRSSITRSR